MVKNMNFKWIGLLVIMLTLLASGAMAYSGFNRYYYTDYYAPAVYYSTPYHVPTYYNTTYYPTTYTTYYNSYYPSYYPSYSYATTYYPSYAYYTLAVGSYSGVSMYKNDSGWGFTISRGSVCGIYGYC